MSVPSDDELFHMATTKAATFPVNTIRPTVSQHQLESYRKRLGSHAERLFCDDGDASIDLWEYNDRVKGFENVDISNQHVLRSRLEGERLFSRGDPKCRFLFVHARNSRDILRVSRQMFVQALTHHQVMPNFLDFVFPFGYQQYAEDSLFSGFREDTRLTNTDGGLVLPTLGRSGRDIRMCYSLKSVESKESNLGFPWSIRQIAVYHSFDLATGKSFWFMIKGNHLIRDRLKSASEPRAEDSCKPSSFESISGSLEAALETHLVLCDWCDEDWRWYLTFLESDLQRLTRRALHVDILKAQILPEPDTYEKKVPIKSITRTLSEYAKRTLSLSQRDKSFSTLVEKTEYRPSFPQPAFPLSPPLPPVLPPGMGRKDGTTTKQKPENDEVLSVRALQQVQVIEDKVNEVLLILESNIKIVKDIRDHYQTIFASEDCPTDIKRDTKTKVAYFKKRVANILGDLQIQLSSAQTLLRLLETRKSIMSGLLNMSTIEASKEFAADSQRAANKMSAMTEAMHQLAMKTKQETVSMRVITLVTLFFLPGTFISTVMSTDIIRFPSQQESGRVFQNGALQLWLIITLPLMAATFIAWWVVYWCVNRRQEQKKGEASARWLP
ncbi:hypothetical protein VTL71DRAFT_7770 [Oculimacula yallundae]|uniref:CorA-like transporter domain-containing protein n=1 Tax=Oculimacula yallundae TaxID=86028 RepID=A0ABR4CVY3_9HELO